VTKSAVTSAPSFRTTRSEAANLFVCSLFGLTHLFVRSNTSFCYTDYKFEDISATCFAFFIKQSSGCYFDTHFAMSIEIRDFVCIKTRYTKCEHNYRVTRIIGIMLQ
jgi:hypothetical protein